MARELLPAEEAAVREVDGRELFFDVYAPQPRLLIVGAVDFAAALARLARFTGFKVSVIDARERFATTERIPDADEVVVAWPQEYLAANPPDDATYAAVLTHEPASTTRPSPPCCAARSPTSGPWAAAGPTPSGWSACARPASATTTSPASPARSASTSGPSPRGDGGVDPGRGDRGPPRPPRRAPVRAHRPVHSIRERGEL